MNVTIGAHCWDGRRRKSLADPIRVEGLVVEQKTWKDKIAEAGRWLNDPKMRSLLGFTIPIALLASGLPPFGLGAAIAATVSPDAVPVTAISDGIRSSIIHGFDPLINLIQSLAYPIAGVMIAGGCLFIMVGNRDRGMSMLQNAAIGYILVQLSPLLLKLLVGIGGAV